MSTIDPIAHHAELTIDPLVFGYAPLIAQGNHQGCADIENDVTQVSVQVTEKKLLRAEMQGAVDTTEYLGMSGAERSLWESILALSEPIDLTIGGLGQQVRDLWPTGSRPITRAALDEITQRPGSRGEDLYGTDTVVTASDVTVALK